MSEQLAFGVGLQPTSFAAITTIYDQLDQYGNIQSTPQSVTVVVTNPTFGGITGLVAQDNGALRASWSAGSGPTAPLAYDVYIQPTTATGLFAPANLAGMTFGLTLDLFALADGSLLELDQLYYVGVRARDPLGNLSLSTASLSAISSGVQPERVLAPGDIPTIVAAVWNELQAGYTTSGSFGKYLDGQVSPKAAQATVDTINNKLGNPVGSTFSADIANVQSSSNLTNTKLGTPAGASVSADIAAVKTDTDTLTSRLSAARAGYLDYLDVAISTRQSASVALSQYTALDLDIAGVLAAVQSIQNNTRFVGIVPTVLSVPNSGTSDYKLFVGLFDETGNPEDPDSQVMNYSIEDTNGTVLVATTAMTRDGVGVYQASYTVASGAPDTDIVFIFTYEENSVAFIQYRTARIQSVSGDIDTLLARLTPTRAANLDFLDVMVSSRLANSDDLTRYSNLLVEHAQTQADIAAVSGKIGTPVFGSVTADITAVRIQTDKIGSPAHTTLAADNAVIEGKLGTPNFGSLADDIAEVQLVVDSIDSKTGTPSGPSVSADIAALSTKIGTPAGVSVSADIAAVKAVDDTINSKVGTPVVSVSADIASLTADVANIQTDLDTANDTLDDIKAKTDTMPADFSDLARTYYVNRMTTVLNNLTGIQEVLVWPEKNGQVVAGTNCSISIKDDLGITIWSGSSAAPGASGVFLFSNAFAPMADGNYYVEISIVVDGSPRVNRQPFVAVG